MAICEGYFVCFVAGFCGTILFLLCTPTGARLRTWWVQRSVFVTSATFGFTHLYKRLLGRSTAITQTSNKMGETDLHEAPHNPIGATQTRIAVLISYINPADDIGILTTYLSYRSELKEQRTPVFYAEVTFPGQQYPTADATLRIAANEYDVRLHRQHLLDSLVECVPQEYDTIVWLDPGVKLLNPTWLISAGAIITTQPAAKLFERAVVVDSGGKVHALAPESSDSKPSAAWKQGLGSNPTESFCGGAWVIRRSALPLLKSLWQETPDIFAASSLLSSARRIESDDTTGGRVFGDQAVTDEQYCGLQTQIRAIPGDALIRAIGEQIA